MVIWFTGLSGSGKTTLSRELVNYFKDRNEKVFHLDGDEIRKKLPKEDFSQASRSCHINRVAYMSSVLEYEGYIVIVSLISPFKENRNIARNLCKNFYEIYLSTSYEECKKRDVKGLYKNSPINFTGKDSKYEVPENPEATINTKDRSIESCVMEILFIILKEID